MVERGIENAQDLVKALAAIGVDGVVEPAAGRRAPSRADFVVRVGGRQVVGEARSVVRESDAGGVAAQLEGEIGSRAYGIVVADQVSEGARAVLRKAGIGWLDRRGHLRLSVPGVLIDTDLPKELRETREKQVDPWSPMGLDVAVALLKQPDVSASPVRIARLIGARSHGRVSAILAELERRFLVAADRKPLAKELFWELAAVWAPRWEPLRRSVAPEEGPFKLSGTIGALWHRAPVAAGVNYPPDLYVPSRRALREVLRTFGLQGEDAAVPAARVAVCPSRFAWGLSGLEGDEFPVADQLVVALDLAQDPRGREILDGWEPDGRVW
jgi:hypothetical protein